MLSKPRWLEHAMGELVLGVHEVPGPKANMRILQYHSATKLKAQSDEVAWCSAFVNWCMALCGVQGTESAAARSWLDWGQPCAAHVGAVVVMRRGAEWQGHVGFFLGASPNNNLIVLGGNQGDSVSVSVFPQTSLLGFRWEK